MVGLSKPHPVPAPRFFTTCLLLEYIFWGMLWNPRSYERVIEFTINDKSEQEECRCSFYIRATYESNKTIYSCSNRNEAVSYSRELMLAASGVTSNPSRHPPPDPEITLHRLWQVNTLQEQRDIGEKANGRPSFWKTVRQHD